MRKLLKAPHQIGRYCVVFDADAERTLASIGLSPREEETLAFLMAGKSGPESAREMGVSPNTVNTFKRRILTKLEVNCMAQAVAIATAWSAGAQISELDCDELDRKEWTEPNYA